MEIQVGGWKQNSKMYKALIDPEDYEKVKDYKWSANTNSSNTVYAYCWTKEQGKLHLHRLIMGLGNINQDERIINHINRNGLDNRKCNLEICNTLYNSQSFNQGRPFGCIYLDTSMKRIKRYKACVTVMGVKHQARFETEDEAKKFLDEIRLSCPMP